MSKTALIVEGGGMKCAYSAGVLDAFLDHKLSFDYCIGVSAGSANVASFLAKQRGRNKRFYTDHIKSPEYFGLRSFFKTGNIFGLNYIYGTLTNDGGADPLDYQTIMDNPSEYYLVATDAETGKPVYFSKQDLIPNDYRHIMASCALPAACKPVEINGRFYYDGGITDAIPIQKALDDGCDKIVVILSKPRDFVKTPEKLRFLYSKLCRKYPNTIKAIDERHLMYQKCQSQTFNLEKEGRAFVFAPSKHLKMGTYSVDQEAEEKLYALGMEDFNTLYKKLEDFLAK